MEDTVKVPLFDGTNFNNWKFRMEVLLEEHNLLDFINQDLCSNALELNTDDETERKAKDKEREHLLQKQRKCKSLIVQRIADSHLEYVKDASTPFEMWEILKHNFQRKGIATQIYLRKKLLQLKLEEKETLENHFLKFDKIVRELKSVDVKLQENDLICHLFLTLPRKYDGIVTALETVEDSRLTMSLVKTKLLDEETKSRNNVFRAKDSCYKSNEAAFTSKSFNFKCYYCGKYGHKKSDCKLFLKMQTDVDKGNAHFKGSNKHDQITRYNNFKKKSLTGNANLAEEQRKDVNKVSCTTRRQDEVSNIKPQSFITVNNDAINWYIDSGATEHMINSVDYFTECKDLATPVKVYVAKSGVCLHAEKVGVVKCYDFVNDEKIEYIFNDVLYVPQLEANLFSVSKIVSNDMKVLFEGNMCKIIKGNKTVAIAIRNRKLYEMKVYLSCCGNANLCNYTNDFSLWHDRLGHIGNSSFKKLQDGNMAENLPKVDIKTQVCKACLQGKQTKLPFKHYEKSTTRPLELIHSDVCGPVSQTGWNGSKYFVTFIDDYTHFTHLYLLKHKSEVFNLFQKYQAQVESKFNMKMSRLRCDNGGEFISKEFKNYCDKKGISVEYTVPRTPQQNGKAERMNRTIVDRARAMLLKSKLSKDFWTEAVLTSTYLINRSPTTALKNKTPAEAWYGYKPDFSKIRVFGCLCYVHIPKEVRSKFDSKTMECFMVGYAPNGYRLYNPTDNKIIIARDVIFCENDTCNVKEHTEIINNADYDVNSDEINADYDVDSNEKLENAFEHDNNENCIESEEDEIENEGVTVEDESITGPIVKRPQRIKRTPIWMEDFDMSCLALNAHSFLSNLPNNYQETLKLPDSTKWKVAMEEEMASLKKNETWELVPRPHNTKVLDCKWVFRIKDEDGSNPRYKARLVARGFLQEKGIDYNETFAPVAKMTTVRTLLAVANHKCMYLHQMDVKTAFLNGNLSEEVFMEQPEGFSQGTSQTVCKLKRSLYGLKQSPRCWNIRFNDFIIKQGFERAKTDHCLYTKTYNSEEKLYLLLYVDDLIIAGNKMIEIVKMKKELSKHFEMTDLGELHNFLGLEIERNVKEQVLTISQEKYLIKVLKRFNMENCNPISTPMEPNFKMITTVNEDSTKPCKQLLGCLMYAMLGSRPDLSASISYLSRYQDKESLELWKCLKRVLRYIKSTLKLKLVYEKKNDAALIEGYSDADWANDLTDRKSTTGYYFNVCGNIISWVTRKQPTVALSTTEAEYMAVSNACCEAIWIKYVLKDMGIEMRQPIVIYEDNLGAIFISKNPENHKRTKHIDIKHHFIRDKINEGVITLKHIKTEDQSADMLTKSLTAVKLIKFRTMVGLKAEHIIKGGC